MKVSIKAIAAASIIANACGIATTSASAQTQECLPEVDRPGDIDGPGGQCDPVGDPGGGGSGGGGIDPIFLSSVSNSATDEQSAPIEPHSPK